MRLLELAVDAREPQGRSVIGAVDARGTGGVGVGHRLTHAVDDVVVVDVARHCNHDVSVAGHENRGLLHCVLGLPGQARSLHAVCVHLGLRESHRRRQLDLLCAHLHEAIPAGEPLVVAGDFNDWRGAGHRRLRDCGLLEVFEARRGRLARSFPVRWPLLPLDRIYVRGLSVLETTVHSARPWSRLSDHAALFARLALDGAPA